MWANLFQWRVTRGLYWSAYFWLAAIAAGYAKLVWNRSPHSGATSWPLVEGRVELTEVGEKNWWDISANLSLKTLSARSARNVAALGYSYSVAGTVYSGTYKREFESEEDAWEFARRLKGSAIGVQYNPNKPSVSVLSEPSIEAPPQSHPTVPEGVELDRGVQGWRIASWIALAAAAWEVYRFIQMSKTHLNIPQARVNLAAALAAFAIARLCNWISVWQKRRATHEKEPPHERA